MRNWEITEVKKSTVHEDVMRRTLHVDVEATSEDKGVEAALGLAILTRKVNQDHTCCHDALWGTKWPLVIRHWVLYRAVTMYNVSQVGRALRTSRTLR